MNKDDLINRRLKVFISAAEVSGDKHAARLIERARQDIGELVFEGLGGEQMERAGCRLMENLTTRSAMLTHAFKQVGFYLGLRKRVRAHFDQDRPDLVVVVDSPAWNFHVARAARERGIPVLYYIAPQLWAWGGWRIGKLRKCVNKVACILPFEEKWFRERKVEADFVGHPLFDSHFQITNRSFRDENAPDFPTIALLPGSRRHEVETLWQPMQQAARIVKQRYPRVKLVSAAASADLAVWLKATADPDLLIDIQQRNIEATVRYADVALVASGTATLEVAAQGCPMAVLYDVPVWQWNLVAKWLLKTPYISLVNIIAGRELVREFIPLAGRSGAVAQEALSLLSDDKRRLRIKNELHRIIEPLLSNDAPGNVTEMIRTMLPQY